jgi:hypothetical protein
MHALSVSQPPLRQQSYMDVDQCTRVCADLLIDIPCVDAMYAGYIRCYEKHRHVLQEPVFVYVCLSLCRCTCTYTSIHINSQRISELSHSNASRIIYSQMDIK